ncbi:hypothetical protein SVAN01_07720 [Stagonosporopsis vannaccii]|nr:hypothetical protein SVAN01_07720 [Stagonosporopsis vannaccii]
MSHAANQLGACTLIVINRGGFSRACRNRASNARNRIAPSSPAVDTYTPQARLETATVLLQQSSRVKYRVVVPCQPNGGVLSRARRGHQSVRLGRLLNRGSTKVATMDERNTGRQCEMQEPPLCAAALSNVRKAS